MRRFFTLLILVFNLVVALQTSAQKKNTINPPANPTSKMGFTLMGSLYKSGNSYIDLYIKKAKNPCDSNASENKYKFEMENMSNYSILGNYLVFKMDFVNCNGDLITRTVSLNLDTYHDDGFNESKDWSYNSKDFPKDIYEIHFSQYEDLQQDINKGKFVSAPPDSIASVMYAKTGQVIELTAVGGNLSTDSKWYWFDGACNKGKPVDSGKVVKIKLLKTTTFFVGSMSNGVPNTPCISKTIIVNDSSYAAIRILGNKNGCVGEDNTQYLKVIGGHLGLDAKWVWYQNNCGSSKDQLDAIGNGEEIEVSPQTSTIYYVRAEGRVNKTECISFPVSILSKPRPPKGIISNQNPICESNKLILTVDPSTSSNDQKWEWSSREASSSYAPSSLYNDSSTITVFPEKSTVFYVKAVNSCGFSEEISTIINVTEASISPSHITQNNTKNIRKFKLTLSGGKLSSNDAVYVWKNSAGDVIHKGKEQQITHKTKKMETVYVSVLDDCIGSSTRSASTTLNPRISTRGPERFVKNFINVGMLMNPADSNSHFVFTYGFRIAKGWQMYLRTKFRLGFRDSAITLDPQFTADDNGLTNYSGAYKFNGRAYAKRSSFTGGFIFNVNRFFKLYFGGGYGKRDLIWGVDLLSPSFDPGKLATNTASSYAGFEGEAGALLKLGPINIMGGINSIYSSGLKKSFNDFDLGIGFAF